MEVLKMALLGRTTQIRYQYHRVELTKEEQEKMQNELLENNFGELDRIMNFLKGKGVDYNKNPEYLRLLAEKQLTSSFTAWQTALEDKVFHMKNKANKPLEKSKMDEIKKTIEEQLGGGSEKK
jgi:hypothetical protein